MNAKANLSSAPKIAALRTQFSADGRAVFEPGSDGYAQAMRIWNGAVTHEPALVAPCRTVDDIRFALAAAQAHGFPISVRGGGHDWAGRALRHGGLVLDLSVMRQVTVKPEAKEAWIAGGATAADVNAATAASGLDAVTGYSGAVGMAGLITGGGYGPLMTRFGLAADSLLAVEVVLADGRLVAADRSQNADLFWALQGGGCNFGVVTSIRIRLHETGPMLGGAILFPWKDARAVLRGYAEIMLSGLDGFASTIALTVGPEGAPVVAVGPGWSGDAAQGEQLMARLQSLGTPSLVKIGPIKPSGILDIYDARLLNGRHQEVRTRWLQDLTPEVISTLIAAFEARISPFSSVVMHHFHGAGPRVAPDATAFGMRREHFTALIYSAWDPKPGEDSAPHRQWAADLSANLAPLAFPGGYANLLAPDAHDQIAAAYGVNAARLARLKQKFDPNNIFSSAIPLPK
ncbi:MAG: FAD-binding oxidoreductase [Dongiaceae bacterium]